jgi:hypothetical protein
MVAAKPTSRPAPISKSVPVSHLCVRRLPRPGRGVSAFSSPNLSPSNSKLLALSAVEGSTFNCFSPKSRRIRIYENRTYNPFRMRTSKTQDLKPFRIRTYEKRRGGRGVLLLTRNPAKDFCPERPSGARDLSSNPTRKPVLTSVASSGGPSLRVGVWFCKGGSFFYLLRPRFSPFDDQAGGGVDVDVFRRVAGRPNKTRSSGCKLSAHALCVWQQWHGGLRLSPATRFIAQNGRQTAS